MEIDTWVGESGKNGMRRDWLLRSQATGHIFARATRWMLINFLMIQTWHLLSTFANDFTNDSVV